MCGAPLEPVTPTREPERTRVSAVGGPSFLGLGDDRTNALDYLLDEEPPHGHGRLYLALLLLALSAGLLAWHWQRDGYPWATLARGPATPGNSAAASAPTTAPSTISPNPTPASPATDTPPASGTPSGQSASPTVPAVDSASSPSSAAEVKPSLQTSQPGSNAADPPAKPPQPHRKIAQTMTPATKPRKMAPRRTGPRKTNLFSRKTFEKKTRRMPPSQLQKHQRPLSRRGNPRLQNRRRPFPLKLPKTDWSTRAKISLWPRRTF